MNFVISINHLVNDLSQFSHILSDLLEFTIEEEQENFVLLNNGALSIRLILDNNSQTQPLRLDISCTDIEQAQNNYLGQGFQILKPANWVSSKRQEIQLQHPLNIHLYLFHHYNEDELNLLPDLDTHLEWQQDALNITQKLLTTVPLSFRENARIRVVQTAENDAIVLGQITINQSQAIQAMIKITPDFQHHHLYDALKHHQLPVKDYFPDA